MILPLLCAIWLLLAGFLITRAVIQYSAYEKIPPRGELFGGSASVALIIPARNEESNIGRCLAGLVQQNYPPGQMRIYIVDDGSTDRTAEIVGEFARRDSRIELIAGSAPPPDWKGKPFACWQGAQRAERTGGNQNLTPSTGTAAEGRGGGSDEIRSSKSKIRNSPHPGPPPEYRGREKYGIYGNDEKYCGIPIEAEGVNAAAKPGHARFDWLCFLDADTACETPLLTSAIALAEDRGIDMLSVEPFQILSGFWDRLILPAGFFLAAFSLDLRRVNDPSLPDAAANGQCIFIRKTVYDSVGGHAAVRTEIAEDSALARLVKHSGFRLMLLGGERLIQTRMYSDLTALWEGISKNLIEMVGGAGKLALYAGAAIVLATAALGLPVWAWVAFAVHSASARTLVAVICSSVGSAAMLGVHVGAARYFKIPLFYGLLFPVAYIIGSTLALDAVRRRRMGRVSWKGRIYSEPLPK